MQKLQLQSAIMLNVFGLLYGPGCRLRKRISLHPRLKVLRSVNYVNLTSAQKYCNSFLVRSSLRFCKIDYRNNQYLSPPLDTRHPCHGSRCPCHPRHGLARYKINLQNLELDLSRKPLQHLLKFVSREICESNLIQSELCKST